MNNQHYCEQKILREGSCLYYSLRFIAPPKRDALLLLHTLFHEIDEIKYKCQDIRIAQQKRDWWKQEINQMVNGKASHPVTQNIKPLIEQYALTENELITMTHTLLHAPNRFADFNQLETYCRRTSGQLHILCAKILGYQQAETLQAVEKLGIMLQLYYFLRELRRDTLHAYIYIPQTELEQFNLSQHALFEQQTTEALLQFQAQRIEQYYQAFLQILPKAERRQQKMGLIRGKLAMETLKEMQQDKLSVFRQKISLTPIRKLWIIKGFLW